jgi:hypothetical protein
VAARVLGFPTEVVVLAVQQALIAPFQSLVLTRLSPLSLEQYPGNLTLPQSHWHSHMQSQPLWTCPHAVQLPSDPWIRHSERTRPSTW